MVFIKQVNNSDPGDIDHFGGNDLDTLDKYFDNEDQDASRTAKIATRTQFLSQKFRIRNPNDTFSYIVVGSAINQDRNVTEPLLTANDTRVYENHTQNIGNKTALSTCNVAAATGGGTPTNVNVSGTGLFKQKTGSNNEFRSVTNGSSSLVTATLNPGTNEIEMDVIESMLDKDNMAGGVFHRFNDTLNVVNDAAETEIFNCLIPGTKMSTNRTLRLTLSADYLCNSGTARTLTLKIKYGATTLYNDVTQALATSASRRAVRLVAELTNMNIATSQQLGGVLMIGVAGGATSGLGDIADDEIPAHTPLNGSATENSALDKFFTVTIQNSAAEANVSFRRQYAFLEVL